MTMSLAACVSGGVSNPSLQPPVTTFVCIGALRLTTDQFDMLTPEQRTRLLQLNEREGNKGCDTPNT